MKQIFYIIISIFLVSCSTGRPVRQYSDFNSTQNYYQQEEPITKSLFDDKSSTISEENIQKILDGTYSLPDNLRISLVKLESNQKRRNYYSNNEEYLKSQQEYLDLFTAKFNQSQRVQKISRIPDLLISESQFYHYKAKDVRTQSISGVYSINSDL